MSQDAKKQLKHDKPEPYMAQFYQALGVFNMNIIARVIDNPELVREITEKLIVWCEENGQCNPGYVWDHRRNMCIKLPDEFGNT